MAIPEAAIQLIGVPVTDSRSYEKPYTMDAFKIGETEVTYEVW
jgi:hypothetical protein